MDYSLTIPFLSAHPTPPTPRTHFTRKSINTTPKYSRFHRYYISSFIQPSSPPLPTNSSPFPPSPCPPLSPGLPSDYILKKRATIIDDDEVPLSPFKKPRYQRSQPIMLSIVPMGPMASFLTSLLVPFQLGELISNPQVDGQGIWISPLSQPIINTTELLAVSPVISRKFFRAKHGRQLFLPTIYDDDRMETQPSAFPAEKEVDLSRPPPQT